MHTSSTIVLTGDRPTGPLHLGHYVGSLQQRVIFQEQFTQYIMIADMQALTDNADNPDKVRAHVTEVALDYLAVGIDPRKTTIFLQSMIPQIAELTIIYLNLVTVNRLKRNPTIKTEIKQRGFGENVPAGFLMYPVHQAADITVVKAAKVPVGEDQLPLIEQTNEIIHTFNRYYGPVFPVVEGVLSKTPRLVGLDGGTKMSKSAGNAIFLSDTFDVVAQKVMRMYTDPNHLKVSDPGKVEGNTVFTYLDVFDPRTDEVAELKAQYRRGGLGDVVLKKRLIDVLNTTLDPIRARRNEYAQDIPAVMQLLKQGSEQVLSIADTTMCEVKKAMRINYYQGFKL